MPTIKIERSSSLKPDEAYDRIKTMMDGDSDLKKLDSSYTCEFDDAAKTIKANGSKFKATVDVNEGSNGSDVAINVDLPMLLSPFKGAVQSSLEKKLDKALG